jgi:hypothetical protein
VIFELDPSLETPTPITNIAVPGPARLKVVDPLLSMGPSKHVEILSASDCILRMRVPRIMFVGSKVQVRTNARIMFGEVIAVTQVGTGSEIVVDVQRS